MKFAATPLIAASSAALAVAPALAAGGTSSKSSKSK